MPLKALLVLLLLVGLSLAQNSGMDFTAAQAGIVGAALNLDNSRFVAGPMIRTPAGGGAQVEPALRLTGFDPSTQLNSTRGFTITLHACSNNPDPITNNILASISGSTIQLGAPLFAIGNLMFSGNTGMPSAGAGIQYMLTDGMNTAMAGNNNGLVIDGVDVANSGLDTEISGTDTCQPSGWRFVALSFDNTGFFLTFDDAATGVRVPNLVSLSFTTAAGMALATSFFSSTGISWIGADGIDSMYGMIDEVTMWNRRLTPAELVSMSDEIVPSNSLDLIAQFSFDDRTNPTLNSVPSSAVVAEVVDLSNGMIPFTDNQILRPAIPAAFGESRSQINVRRFAVPIGSTVNTALGIQEEATSAQPEGVINIDMSQLTAGTFNAQPQASNQIAVTFVATGSDLCNGNSLVQNVSWFLSLSPGVSKTIMFEVFSTPTVNDVVYVGGGAGTPTEGGELQLIGSSFGAGGPFVSGDGVDLEIEGVIVPCAEPTADSTTLFCDMPPGVGVVPLTIRSCGGVGTATVTYAPPRVDNFVIDGGARLLTINGANFGDSSRADRFSDPSDMDNRIEFGTTMIPCPIASLDHVQIVCTIPQQFNPSSDVFLNQDINITVGGLQADGNLRVGGQANQNDNETILIAALVASLGGCCCISICVVVGLLVALKLKRGKNVAVAEAPFIPVEDRDFTTVIFGSEAVSSVKKTSELKRLEELLTNDPEMKLALEIGDLTQITEADNISRAMVIAFENVDKTLNMLKVYIDQEVNSAENPATLFRANSMVSKMFKFYSRLIGLPYLYITIGKSINQLMFQKLGIEVDPEKMEEGEDLNEMRWNLLAQSQKILKHILNSDSDCPLPFRHLCWQLRESVSERYDDHVDKTIGGFIFLRFFCPAVTSPEIYGIIDEPPSPESRRLLILITKSLQNLANDVEFGSKEPYMSNMNEFIKENRGRLHEFYEKIILKPKSSDSYEGISLPKGVPENALKDIAEHLSNNLDKIKNQELRRELTEILSNE